MSLHTRAHLKSDHSRQRRSVATDESRHDLANGAHEAILNHLTTITLHAYHKDVLIADTEVKRNLHQTRALESRQLLEVAKRMTYDCQALRWKAWGKCAVAAVTALTFVSISIIGAVHSIGVAIKMQATLAHIFQSMTASAHDHSPKH